MRIRSLVVLVAVLALSIPAIASTTTLFTRYEAVRQNLLKRSLDDVKSSAASLAAEARKAKQPAIATKADAVANSANIAAARTGFAALSDELIKVRNGASGTRPAVYHCSMVKKSWLQPKGKVGNPYDPAMAMCGELKAE